MSNFIQNFELPDTGVSKSLLQTWAEQLNPTSEVTDDDTIKVVANKFQTGNVILKWAKFRHSYTSFQTANPTSLDLTLISLGAGAVLHAIKANVRTAFSGTGIATALLNVGLTPGAPTEYLSAIDMEVLTTATPSGKFLSDNTDMWLTENGTTNLLANMVVTGANTDALDAGEVDIWALYSIADSAL